MDYVIIDPKTGEAVAWLNDNEAPCYGSPCGGCDHCLLQQAEFGNFTIVEVPPPTQWERLLAGGVEWIPEQPSDSTLRLLKRRQGQVEPVEFDWKPDP